MTFLPLEPLEVATSVGLARPSDEVAPSSSTPRTGSPRQALREVLRTVLQRGSCVVSFSGGRDSSAILAVAVEVARREELPVPVPVTLRFPGRGGTQEDAWQEAVVRHLGLREWQKVAVDDELDLVGPVAAALLRAHGLPLPPQVQTLVPVAALASGGTVLTGTGGDELFTPWRSSRRAAWSGARRVRSVRAVKHALLESAPHAVRARAWERRLQSSHSWLRAAPRKEVAQRYTTLMAPTRGYADALQQYRRSRGMQLLLSGLSTAAATQDARVEHPMLDPRFLVAVEFNMSEEGFHSRTTAMREFVGDLLPQASVSRSTKAVFNDVFWGRHAQAFAKEWDGSGVDHDIVDPEVLREVWQRPLGPLPSWCLLQQAWRHQDGGAG